MSSLITHAEVFDPALSGDYDTPPRLEIGLAGHFATEEDPFVEEVGPYDVTHFRWLQEIESTSVEWNDLNEAERAAQYNSSMFAEGREPVVPVTVLGEWQKFWQVFYIKVSRARTILNFIRRTTGQNVYYEVVPDPTYAIEKKSAYTFMHPARKCVACVNESMTEAAEMGRSLQRFSDIESMCGLQRVRAHRVVPMCDKHQHGYREHMESARKLNRG